MNYKFGDFPSFYKIYFIFWSNAYAFCIESMPLVTIFSFPSDCLRLRLSIEAVLSRTFWKVSDL